MLHNPAPLPEVLPGEPAQPPPRPSQVARTVGAGLAQVLLLAVLGAPLWPLYALLALVLGRPPVVPRAARLRRALGAVLRPDPEAPALPAAARASALLYVLVRVLLVPFAGLAWWLDALLYGRALQRVVVRPPLFEISAARSGSTQLAHMLEEDPRLLAPTILQGIYPFVWVWVLARALFGRWVTPEQIQRRVSQEFPPAFLERHEFDIFRTDTYENVFGFAVLLRPLFFAVGPRLYHEEFAWARCAPAVRAEWEEDYVAWLDALGRKVLYFAGARQGERRLMVKGHFLNAAPALAARYPGACFLTVLRDPVPRVQSMVNFMRVQPLLPLCPPPPWHQLVEQTLRIEVEYCEEEQRWFTRTDGVRRVVVRFGELVRDPQATLARVYTEGLDLPPLPGQGEHTHRDRKRGRYAVNRSLEQLGVDTEALRARLAPYLAWCSGP